MGEPSKFGLKYNFIINKKWVSLGREGMAFYTPSRGLIPHLILRFLDF